MNKSWLVAQHENAVLDLSGMALRSEEDFLFRYRLSLCFMLGRHSEGQKTSFFKYIAASFGRVERVLASGRFRVWSAFIVQYPPEKNVFNIAEHFFLGKSKPFVGKN